MIMTQLWPRRLCVWLVTATGSWAAAAAWPQDAAPADAAPKQGVKSTAQMDAGEPRADTSTPVSGQPGAPAPAAANDTPARSTAKPAQRGTGRVAPKAPAGVDRVDLGTATVTGDREQPKVMYIVPWKSSDIGDLSGKPMNSLLDEALAPVDRDEFKREVAYFDAVKVERPAKGQPAKQVEK